MSQSSASSPPNNDSKRKQPTIASFFTKKPSSSSQKAPGGIDTQLERDSRGQGEDGKKGESKQQYGIRKPEEAEEDGDDDDGDIVVPASKRARTNGRQPQDPELKRESPLGEKAQTRPPSQKTNLSKFTSSPAVPSEGVHDAKCQESRERAKEREKLHQQFVKRLGGPDCLVGIGSRNTASEAVAATDEVDADEDEELTRPPPAKGKATAKKSGSKLTPLEKQVIDIKRKHMDTILVVEVGYKFRFFGEDARTAAKELSIVCIPGKFRYDERRYFAPFAGD